MGNPAHQIDAGDFSKEIQILLNVTVPEYGINRNIQGLEKCGHFGENHIRSDVAAMNDRVDRPEHKFAGRRLRQIHLTVCIGYNADFHCMSLLEVSSWHCNRSVYISRIRNQCERRFK